MAKFSVYIVHFFIYFGAGQCASLINFLINSPPSTLESNNTSKTKENKTIDHSESTSSTNIWINYPYLSLLIDNITDMPDPVKQEIWKSLTLVDDNSKEDWDKLRKKLVDAKLKFDLNKSKNESLKVEDNSADYISKSEIEKNRTKSKNEEYHSGYLYHSDLAQQLNKYYKLKSKLES